MDISAPPKLIEIGKAEILRTSKAQEDRVLLLGLGKTVQSALYAAEELAKQGVECTVVNTRFVKPLDEKLLISLIAEHSIVLSIEDHCLEGGFGSAVLEFMSDNGLTYNRNLIRLGIEDFFVEHGTQEELYSICEFDAGAIIERVKTVLGQTSYYKSPALATTDSGFIQKRRYLINPAGAGAVVFSLES